MTNTSTVSNGIILLKVVLTLPENVVVLGKLQVRVGFEILSTFGRPLTNVNTVCGDLDMESSSTQFIIKCTEALMGRYLSIQLMQYGFLHLDEVKILPEPGE